MAGWGDKVRQPVAPCVYIHIHIYIYMYRDARPFHENKYLFYIVGIIYIVFLFSRHRSEGVGDLLIAIGWIFE